MVLIVSAHKSHALYGLLGPFHPVFDVKQILNAVFCSFVFGVETGIACLQRLKLFYSCLYKIGSILLPSKRVVWWSDHRRNCEKRRSLGIVATDVYPCLDIFALSKRLASYRHPILKLTEDLSVPCHRFRHLLATHFTAL